MKKQDPLSTNLSCGLEHQHGCTTIPTINSHVSYGLDTLELWMSITPLSLMAAAHATSSIEFTKTFTTYG
jgi:hypothetical protein